MYVCMYNDIYIQNRLTVLNSHVEVLLHLLSQCLFNENNQQITITVDRSTQR